MKKDLPLNVLFTRKVDKTGECWIWQGKISQSGYGHFAYNKGVRTTVLAHRFGYELWVGPIPAGMYLDHLCRNKVCVNPAHLEPVTPGENNRRHYVLQETCANGHALTEGNIYIPPRHPNQRKCRECRRAVQRQNYLRRHSRPPL